MNRAKYLIFLLSFSTLLVVGNLYIKSGVDQNNLDKLESKMIPNEHLLFQRSFPDNELNVQAVDKLRKKVKAQIASATANKNVSNTPWEQEGPTNIGGRINCVVVDPNDDDHILTGCSAGGIYETTDGGSTWQSIGDEMADLSTSSIVFDPTDSDVIYVGTGDHNISGTVNAGGGAYKSVDGGMTWQNIGLIDQRIVSRLVIDPTNTQVIYAATMGLPFVRNTERGLYKSEDGGSTWEQILFVSDEAGIIDLVMNPSNPNQLYAASWNRIRNNSESMVSGTDGHIYRTNDGGENWVLVDGGTPMESGNAVSRIGLAMSQQNPGKVFSVIVGSNLNLQGVYALEPNATEWNELNSNDIENALAGFGWFFGQIRVNPNNDDEISVLGVDLWTSTDGGNNWSESTPIWWTYEVHADKHDMVYNSEGEVLLATDGGLYKGELFEEWTDIDEIPNSQFYRIAVNPWSDLYTGGLQDNGTTSGDINNTSNWSRDRGGDGFQPVFSPDDPEIYYSLTQNGGIARYNSNFDEWDNFTGGIDDDDRTNWDSPLIMSTHNSNVLYTGTYRIYKNTDAYNDNWEVISPSLTGEVITSNSFHTISTIGESRVNPDVLYSGSTDAKVWRTLDGGENWSEINAGLPERYVTNIKTSDIEEGTVYITHSGYKDDDNVSHIHKSVDFGDNWIDVSGDLPELPINHLEVIDEDKLMIATDMGVYYSENAGTNWIRVGNNMPLIPVFDIEIDYEKNKLLAGTFARSMMSFPLDSILPEPVGIEEFTDFNDVKIYPNPTQDYLMITSKEVLSKIQIFDNQSKNVLTLSRLNDNVTRVEMNFLPIGIYSIVMIDQNGQTFTKSVVKQ